MRTLSYVLVALSGAWFGAVLLVSSWITDPLCFYVTTALVAVNFVVSITDLIRRSRVLVLINIVQLPLFGLMNYQVFRAFGPHHYHFERDPAFQDWIQLTAVHVLRAVDLLDGLEAYGIDLQNVEHNSVLSGTILVFMHLAVDIFLLAVLFRLLRALFKLLVDKGKAKRRAVILMWMRRVGLVICVLLIVVCGITQKWRPADWFLWPVDNVLRTIDIGDMFQIFHWRLHGVTMDLWTVTLAVSWRLLAGVFVGEQFNRWRLKMLGGLGKTVHDLIHELSDNDPAVRQAAAEALGRIDPVAKDAVPHLIEVLSDTDLHVSRAAAHALGKMGYS